MIDQASADRPPILFQTAVIAYRVRKARLQVLLVTSRETFRWIIPKGNVGTGKTPAEAAAEEAYEEAGVTGVVSAATPFGFYTYFKRLASGESRAATVEVYLFRVTEQHKKWPEKGQRKLSWLPLKKAIQVVQEPNVVPLLQRLTKIEALLALPGNDQPSPPAAG